MASKEIAEKRVGAIHICMTNMNWDHYRTFLAVMEHGSLSAAARQLGLTQPTAGRHIGQLEESLGHRLFLRGAGGLMPTEQAFALQPHARAMAHAALALERTASGMAGKVEGTVRISASEIVGIEILPPILADLQEHHPGLEIELSASDEVEDLLRREADVAVRMAEPSQDALLVRYLGEIPLGFHATKTYLDRHGRPESMEGLQTHRIVGFDRQTAFIRGMAKRFPEATDPRFSFRTDSTLAQLRAISAGCGIGICQLELARQNPELERLLPAFTLPLPTWVAMHEDLKSSPRCRAVFDALVAGLSRHMAG